MQTILNKHNNYKRSMKTLFFTLVLGILLTSTILAAESGDVAPICNITDFTTQEPININDYKGKVIYLDFWASWCPPCKQSFPALNKLHNELKNKGFEVLAVNLDQEKEDANQFLHANPVEFTIAYDAQSACPKAYEVMAMPSSYIIDKQGVIRKIHLGFKENDVTEIQEVILTLLAE